MIEVEICVGGELSLRRNRKMTAVAVMDIDA